MKRLNARLGAAVAALLIIVGSGIPIARAAQSHAQVTLHMWGWADET
jgi:ABC-type proline/glycine betaine transport system substrate-binding protein